MYEVDSPESMRRLEHGRPYPDEMAVPARDIAAALRERLPGLGTLKLHKLLYYCQGHHLATFGRPLFSETISAWDKGPVVGSLWREEKYGAPPEDAGPVTAPLGEEQLNTVGYVVSRYGALTGTDLEHLTHSEAPWQTADRLRQPGGRVTIKSEWIREYFRTDGNPAAGEEEIPLDSEAVAAWLADARDEPKGPDQPGDRDKLAGMRAEVLERLAGGQ